MRCSAISAPKYSGRLPTKRPSCFPPAPDRGPARLARDHARLRSGIEALQRAADGGSLDVLARVTRDLLFQLERHLAAEERPLSPARAGRAAPPRPRRWADTCMSGIR